MSNVGNFCTCQHINCPLHPNNHNKGCTPCIAKNLKLKEIPNCFFNLIDNSSARAGDTFIDFANCVCNVKSE